MTCWSIPCAADRRLGHASESIYVTCLKHCGHRKRLPTPMTIRHANGGKGARKKRKLTGAGLAPRRKNRRQFLRRNHFELVVSAVAGFFVRSPSAKLRCMTEAVSLHVVVSDFHDELGPQRFPR